MSYPRLIVDVNKFRQNVRTVTGWGRKKGISVAYVTKCTLSDPVLTKAAREEGVALFADSRLPIRASSPPPAATTARRWPLRRPCRD